MKHLSIMSDSGFFTPCGDLVSLSMAAGLKYEFEVLVEEPTCLESHLDRADVYQIGDETVLATLQRLEHVSAGPARPNALSRWRGTLLVEDELEQSGFLDRSQSTSLFS